MKVMVSSLLVMGLALLAAGVVEWLPRFSPQNESAYAVDFSVYPPRIQSDFSRDRLIEEPVVTEGAEGSVHPSIQSGAVHVAQAVSAPEADTVAAVRKQSATKNIPPPAKQSIAWAKPVKPVKHVGSKENAKPVYPALDVRIVSAVHKQPVKANVYVQRENGVNVSSQRYVSAARFNLPPGRYKVTAKARGHNDWVRLLTLGKGGLRQTLALQEDVPPVRHHSKLVPARPAPAVRAPAPVPAPAHQPVAGSKPAVVPRPTVTRSAAPRPGRLQLHAVSATDGQPLPVHFRITALDGTPLHHAPGVAYAEMNVPAGQVRIHIQHQGISGSEVAQVRPGEITTHTFSVVPPQQVAVTQVGTERQVVRPRLGLGIGIGPLMFRVR